MSILGTLYYGSLRYSGLSTLLRNTRRGGAVLCYHNVVGNAAEAAAGDPGLHAEVDEFAEQMRWLAARFRPVSLQAFYKALADGGDLRRMVAVTFDDAYNGVLDYGLPVTRDLGIPVCLFVVGRAPTERSFWWDLPSSVARADAERDRWLYQLQGDGEAIRADTGSDDAEEESLPECHRPASWSRLARIAQEPDVTIGAHGLTHRFLPVLSDEDLHDELTGSAEAIQSELGRRPRYVAYPYGGWSPRVLAAARAAGYEGGMALHARLNDSGVDPLAVRRVPIPSGLPLSAFQAWVLGLGPNMGAPAPHPPDAA